MSSIKLQVFLFLSFIIISKGNASILISNGCHETIWPGVYTQRGKRVVPTGIKLDPEKQYDLKVPDTWSGIIWARTGCDGNPNTSFHCATGDCGANSLHCHYNTPQPPVTLTKFNLVPKGGTSTYKVDLRNGFNLPVTLTPLESRCQKIMCFKDWRNQCPDWLSVYSHERRKIACKSACYTTGEPKHCCTGAFASPQKCELNQYTELVENQCPSAVSNAFDDTHYTCFGGASYFVSFCA